METLFASHFLIPMCRLKTSSEVELMETRPLNRITKISYVSKLLRKLN